MIWCAYQLKPVGTPHTLSTSRKHHEKSNGQNFFEYLMILLAWQAA